MGAALERGIPGTHKGKFVYSVNFCIWLKKLLFFSMFKTTKMPIKTGSDWNRTRKALNGSGNAGTCIICSSTNSKWSLT